MSNDDDLPDLGTCCGCGGTDRVRNIVMLDRRGPSPGKGWSCLVCGLPADGAIVVMCDRCMEGDVEPRFVVVGYPKANERMPIVDLAFERFEHNEEIHRRDEGLG
jgi:hypothetical protein